MNMNGIELPDFITSVSVIEPLPNNGGISVRFWAELYLAAEGQGSTFEDAWAKGLADLWREQEHRRRMKGYESK